MRQLEYAGKRPQGPWATRPAPSGSEEAPLQKEADNGHFRRVQPAGPTLRAPRHCVLCPQHRRSADAACVGLSGAAKASPNELNFASAGIGSGSHFAAERLRISAGFEAQHIPFRGATEGLTEALAGRVDFFFVPPAPALSLSIKDGKLVALAVSAAKRATALPHVPTTTEAGLVDSAYDFWVAVFLPAKTPRDIVVRLHQETDKALQMPAVQQRLAALGVEPMPLSLEQFDKYFRDDVEATVSLVKAAKIVASLLRDADLKPISQCGWPGSRAGERPGHGGRAEVFLPADSSARCGVPFRLVRPPLAK